MRWEELSPADQAQSIDTWGFYDAARALGSLAPPLATARSHPRTHTKKDPSEHARTYLSRYVGVTQRHGHWTAQWGKRGSAYTKQFGKAPEDELRAAHYRAQVLGLSEPEVRR